jgi:hypothetical protein
MDLSDLADALLGLAEAEARGPADAVGDHILPLLVSRAEQEIEWLARVFVYIQHPVLVEVTVGKTTLLPDQARLPPHKVIQIMAYIHGPHGA